MTDIVSASSNVVQTDKLQVDPGLVIARYMEGAQVSELALELGVSSTTIYRALLAREEEWKQAQALRALASYEQAKEELESAPDPRRLWRARERIKLYQWELERLLRRVYGEERTQAQAVAVSIVLDFSQQVSERTLTED